MSKKESAKNSKVETENLKPVDYERAGKMFVDIVATTYAKRWRIYYFSIIKGFFSGLGGVIGATVGVAILLYILSFFDSVPIIDHFIRLVETDSPTNNFSQ